MENSYLDQFRQDNLRPAQLKLLSILQEIAAICDRHQIPYWLDGGTLLGAVRHGGFIPWDDDLDISMRKEDMERFVQIAPAELPEWLVLQTPETDVEMNGVAYKVRDLNSFFVEQTDYNKASYQKGLFVDIFPFVNYPSSFHKLTKKVARGICIANSYLHTPHLYSNRSVVEFLYFKMKYSLLMALWTLMKPLAKNGEYTCSFPLYNWYGVIYRTDSLFPLGRISFEGLEFSAPHNPDAYLTSIYRNYMQLPPPEKRAVHSLFILPELIKKENKK